MGRLSSLTPTRAYSSSWHPACIDLFSFPKKPGLHVTPAKSMINREHIMRDCRAKIMWGESREAALHYLQANGVGDKDAMAEIELIFRERAADIRKTGIKKIVIGCFWIAVLLGYLAICVYLGFVQLKLLAVAIVAAVVGLWKVIEGIGFILRPSSHSGDLSNLSD